MSDETPTYLDCPECSEDCFHSETGLWAEDRSTEYCSGCGCLLSVFVDDGGPDEPTARAEVVECGGSVVAQLRAEVERLTRERDAQRERAEIAERERDEARREVCLRRARDHGPRFGDDKAFERDARALAKRLGWECFGDNCPECSGEGGRHAMSCSRGGGKGQLVVPVTDARGDDGCLHCDAPVVAPSEQACEHPKCKDGFIETWAGEGPPIRTRCPRCARAWAGDIKS